MTCLGPFLSSGCYIIPFLIIRIGWLVDQQHPPVGWYASTLSPTMRPRCLQLVLASLRAASPRGEAKINFIKVTSAVGASPYIPVPVSPAPLALVSLQK